MKKNLKFALRVIITVILLSTAFNMVHGIWDCLFLSLLIFLAYGVGVRDGEKEDKSGESSLEMKVDIKI